MRQVVIFWGDESLLDLTPPSPSASESLSPHSSRRCSEWVLLQPWPQRKSLRATSLGDHKPGRVFDKCSWGATAWNFTCSPNFLEKWNAGMMEKAGTMEWWNGGIMTQTTPILTFLPNIPIFQYSGSQPIFQYSNIPLLILFQSLLESEGTQEDHEPA